MVQTKLKGTIMLIKTAKIDHIWAELKGARYFSSLDIGAGYHHISIHPDSRPKTAFICPYDKSQWKHITYNIAHASSIFLNAVFKLFFQYLDDFLIFYVDNIMVYSKTENEHLAHLRKVFKTFCYARMKLKPSKCYFFKLHIEYLGHLISDTGIYPLEQKIQAILDLAPPTNVTQVQHILGLASYYRKFIPIFSLTVSPINPFMKKNTPFVWMVACQTALDTIGHMITNSPTPIYPDPSREYHLFTDALNHTWSGVLTQQRCNSETNGNEECTYHPITYQSSTFSTSQPKWSTNMKECYVIMMSFHKMAFYLLDAEVILRSDHAPLEKLIKNQTKNTLTQNWALEIFSITPYITFKHIKGKDNILADSLTQLQRLSLYEKCPCEKDNQDQVIAILDKGESIKAQQIQGHLHPQYQT